MRLTWHWRKANSLLVAAFVCLAFLALNMLFDSESQIEISLTVENRSITPVDVFGESAFVEASARFPINDMHCVKVRYLTPSFTICVHDPSLDKYISGAFIQSAGGGGWEREISLLLKHAMSVFEDAVLVDVGANLGVHSLAVAALGHRVVAVEPLSTNMVKLYKSVEVSGLSSHVRLLHNAVDMQPGSVVIDVTSGNVGGSHVVNGHNNNSATNHVETVKAVTLFDVVNDVIKQHWPQRDQDSPIPVVIKMDVELHECRVLLGSPEVFEDERIFIPYIVMEWNFQVGFNNTNPACSKGMLSQLSTLSNAIGMDAALVSCMVSQAVVAEAVYRLAHAMYLYRTNKYRHAESFELLDAGWAVAAVAVVISKLWLQSPWSIPTFVPVWIAFRALNLSWSSHDQTHLIESQGSEIGLAMAYNYWTALLRDFLHRDFKKDLARLDPKYRMYRKVVLIPLKTSTHISEIEGEKLLLELSLKSTDFRAVEQRADIRLRLVEIECEGKSLDVVYDCPRIIKSALGKPSRMANAKVCRVNLDRFYQKLSHLCLTKRDKRKSDVEVDLIRFDDSAPDFSLVKTIFAYYEAKQGRGLDPRRPSSSAEADQL